MAAHPSLLDEALEAHGGLARWREVGEVRLAVRAGGFLLATRVSRRVARGYEVAVATDRPHSTFTPYPGPGRRGVFEPDRVRIEDGAGAVVAERADPRSAWPSLRRNFRWDELDLLYFAGYAFCNYATLPFLLAEPGFELRELEPWTDRGVALRRLAVTFPPGFPTHSREQVVHFDEAGLMRRLDYTAEVVGGWAKAAHYTDAHRPFAGLMVPTRRRVYPRLPNGHAARAPTLVSLDIAAAEIAARGA